MGNACKKAGIRPGATLGTRQAEALWKKYDKKNRDSLPSDVALSFLKDYAKALNITFDLDTAREVIKECDASNTGNLSKVEFFKLCVEASKNKVNITHSLQLSVSGSDESAEAFEAVHAAMEEEAAAPTTSTSTATAAPAAAPASSTSAASAAAPAASTSSASTSAAAAAPAAAPAKKAPPKSSSGPDAIFDEYRAMNLSGEKMDPSGLARFAEDLGINPDDLVLSVFAWKCECEGSFCHISKAEFVRGFEKLRAKNMDQLKSKLPSLRNEIKTDDGFKGFYQFIFMWAKGPNARVLSTDIAVALWGILLPDHFAQLKEFSEFFEANVKKPVNKDSWDSVLDFAREVKNDRHMENYVNDGFYAVVIDDFVEWYREEKAPK